MGEEKKDHIADMLDADPMKELEIVHRYNKNLNSKIQTLEAEVRSLIINQVNHNKAKGYMVCNRIPEKHCPFNGCVDKSGCSEWYDYDKFINALKPVEGEE